MLNPVNNLSRAQFVLGEAMDPVLNNDPFNYLQLKSATYPSYAQLN